MKIANSIRPCFSAIVGAIELEISEVTRLVENIFEIVVSPPTNDFVAQASTRNLLFSSIT